MRTITLNEDDMREPCDHNNLATCGHCNRSWCDTCNPTPSARCPFEYEHEYDDSELSFDDLVEDFWLLAEPPYDKFDELAKARINAALKVFKEYVDGKQS